MKYCRFKDKHGKWFKLFYDTENDSFEIVVNEVFFEECYKKGLDWIKKINNPIVVDIGAFIGDTALYFNQCKGAQIYALEPSKNNFNCLVHTVSGFKNIKVLDRAILNESGTINLNLGNIPGNGGESFYQATKQSNKSEKVIAITLDYFMKLAKIDHIDLLKIDIEGAEYEVLGGPMFEKLNKKVDAIIGETHITPALPCIIEKMLTDYGYKFEWLPYKNMTYHWESHSDTWSKNVVVNLPTLFFAHR